MRKRLARSTALVLAGMLVAAACTQDRPDPSAAPPAPSPSASKARGSGLCQPFPDRLFDEFLAAYNDRDLGALEDLVVAPRIEDLVAGAYGGRSSFEDVTEWARAAWDAGDRVQSMGYSAFHPSKTGFQMLVTRTSDRLAAAGIDRVST
ncbi:MAG: hypothetical protein M3217_01210, partial [Actinomycetota bacterium]|nr:hypothetical protein [Actinomycetota bacterium]